MINKIIIAAKTVIPAAMPPANVRVLMLEDTAAEDVDAVLVNAAGVVVLVEGREEGRVIWELPEVTVSVSVSEVTVSGVKLSEADVDNSETAVLSPIASLTTSVGVFVDENASPGIVVTVVCSIGLVCVMPS
jgi:intracellular sulfur oxidation DsrE/DsrF family protein